MEEAHIVLMEENEIVVDPDLLESIARKLNTLGKPNEAVTIFHVPYKFRQSMENLFEPSVVSIGPFHHGNTRVQAEEEQKWQILRDFLSRGDHISLNLCLSEIKKLEEKTRRCYGESVPLDSNSFVEMMLLDGCFLLDYFLCWNERRSNSIGHSVFILSDFLLLENQIPFFIVEKLFKIGVKPVIGSGWDFKNYVVNKVFTRTGPAVLYHSIIRNPPDENHEIHHLVHLCYHSLIPIDPRKPIASSSQPFFLSMLSTIKYLLLIPLRVVLRIIFPPRKRLSFQVPISNLKGLVIPCATELQNAGIKLRQNSDPGHLIDVSFVHRVLKIPRLTITNETKTLLANLVAFEQYRSDKNSKMSANLSSFALLLGSLVHTPEDVKILKKCEIVNNCLDSDEELIAFFKQICQVMVVEKDHFLAELFKKVDRYCESSWGKRRARWNMHKKQFLQDYFSSPWTAISLVAAVLVLLLTCVTSFYAVYAYYVPPS